MGLGVVKESMCEGVGIRRMLGSLVAVGIGLLIVAIHVPVGKLGVHVGCRRLRLVVEVLTGCSDRLSGLRCRLSLGRCFLRCVMLPVIFRGRFLRCLLLRRLGTLRLGILLFGGGHLRSRLRGQGLLCGLLILAERGRRRVGCRYLGRVLGDHAEVFIPFVEVLLSHRLVSGLHDVVASQAVQVARHLMGDGRGTVELRRQP